MTHKEASGEVVHVTLQEEEIKTEEEYHKAVATWTNRVAQAETDAIDVFTQSKTQWVIDIFDDGPRAARKKR